MTDTSKAMVLQAIKDASSVPQGLKNTILPCCPHQRKLNIGIFFDGTGNYYKFDRDQAIKAQEWEKDNPNIIEDALRERNNIYEEACKKYNVFIRQKQIAAEARLAHDEYKELKERLFAEIIDGVDYPHEADTLDAWRQAKSQAIRYGQIADDAEKSAQEAEAEYRQLLVSQCRHEENFPSSPDESAPTNIGKLHLLYSDKPDHFLIYIRGVSTVKEATTQDDYTMLGQAFGLGAEGGRARIMEAYQNLHEILEEFSDCPPAEVTLDIFGFSRGAALARHFVNIVQDGLPDFSKEPKRTSQNPPVYGALRYKIYRKITRQGESYTEYDLYHKLPNVKIRYVGLFDTVGSFYWPGDSDEGDFILSLSEKHAGRIMHIVAADERRENFRYTSIGKAGVEITIPGVHSDIGGGYKSKEKVFLVMDKEYYIYTQRGSMYAAEQAIANRAIGKGLWQNTPVPPPGYFFKHIEEHRNNFTMATCYLLRTKITYEGYSLLPMIYMYKDAKNKEVPFIDIDSEFEDNFMYAVPEDLKKYIGNINSIQRDVIWEKYLHVSAVDMAPVEAHRLPALGYFSQNLITCVGMRLDFDFLPDRGVFIPKDI